MGRCLRWSGTILQLVVTWAALATCVGVVWERAAAVGMQIAVVAVAGAAVVYTLASSRSWAFEPPTPQRGAVHAIVLSALYWLGGLAVLVGELKARAVCRGRVYTSHQADWLALAAAAWSAAGICTVYVLVRMCMTDCVARLRRDRQAKRRRRAAQQPRQQHQFEDANIAMESVYDRA